MWQDTMESLLRIFYYTLREIPETGVLVLRVKGWALAEFYRNDRYPLFYTAKHPLNLKLCDFVCYKENMSRKRLRSAGGGEEWDEPSSKRTRKVNLKIPKELDSRVSSEAMVGSIWNIRLPFLSLEIQIWFYCTGAPYRRTL